VDIQRVDRALEALRRGVAARDLEDDCLDFKQARSDVRASLELLADAAVCFANAAGGWVVVGVDDKAATPKEAIVGVPSVYTIEAVRKGIFDRTRPHLTCFVEERELDGQRLVLVAVPHGVGIHANAKGTATRRLGTECQPFTPDQQREALVARGHIDWSAESSKAIADDLSAAEFDRLRALLARAGKRELVDLDNRRLLNALRLTLPDGSLTNAAVLILGAEPVIEAVVPTYGYSYQFRPTAGAEAIARQRGRRPLLWAVETLLDLIDSRREVHPLTLAGGVQLQLSDYPLDAVRELVVNGLIHRSYETNGTVDIEHTAEELTIASPGGLVAGVTPMNILTYPSTPRHRLLTETVATMQLAERTGQGVDRAYRELLRSGKEPPSFEDLGTLVRVLISGGVGNDAFVRFLDSLPDRVTRDVDVLLALSFLRRSRTIDAVKLAQVVQRSVGEAGSVLARLADLDLVELTRRTAGNPTPRYRLRSATLAGMARAVTYRRRGVDDTDQKIIEHVREYRYVTNRTVQRLFDVNVYAARNILTDLRRRDVLTKIGDARGGPGVRYGPGDKFPN